MPKKFADPVTELGLILSGSSMENLKSILADPDADLTPGDLAVAGEALLQIGGDLKEAAKNAALPHIEGMVGVDAAFSDNGAVFKWRKGGERTTVDSAAVKKLFPPDEEPSLYKKSVTRPSVMVEITR